MPDETSTEFFETPNWFCLRTKPKSEHLAAAALRHLNGVEVYCPRIRFPRATARGEVMFMEALFPCYVFARFVPSEIMRGVVSAKGVTKILQFGEMPAVIPDVIIQAVRDEMKGEDLRDVTTVIEPGDEVEVTDGAFRGIEGMITRIKNGSDRVHILMEILGELHEVEVGRQQLKLPRNERGWIAA
ncbi:MAG: transcription termination/antitermination NusG family protein [Verrucomicrobiota bacterium]